MPDRRQFLAATAALPLTAIATQGAAALPAGTVTNPTGSVGSRDMASLIDCYVGNWGGIVQPPPPPAVAQWQMTVMLGSSADLCARVGLQGNGYYTSGEITLRLVLLGVADPGASAPIYPPAADLPLTFIAHQALPTSDGLDRYCKPYANQAKSNGNAGSDVAATGGTVTFTRMDAGGYDGSYDLTFPSGGTAAGSFVAPWCGAAP